MQCIPIRGARPIRQQPTRFRLGPCFIAGFLAVPLTLLPLMTPEPFAEAPPVRSAELIAQEAKTLWESSAIPAALDLLDQGILSHPGALTLKKLRGDILATSRDPQEAVQAYETVLAQHPSAVDVRWAKWSVLTRWGQADASITELRRIAQVDERNPLVHLRLAQELRKLDRLEESLVSYEKAVELVPDLLSWRLALARARFDLLDYQAAGNEVQYVLHKIPPGSPLEQPANALRSLVDGSSMERGRRFQRVLTPDATEAQLKEWAFLRADAWRLFSGKQYQEAEPIYRRMLNLNPVDPTATYQFGMTLMQLGKCQEALNIFRKLSDLDATEEEYTDSVFRMGQCLADLERWEDAFVHFQILYDSALEFEKTYKNVQLPPGTRVLDKNKLAAWLDKVRPHVPDWEKLNTSEAAPDASGNASAGSTITAEADLYKRAMERLKPQKLLDPRASLVGRDADFSLFRFVIPSGKVMRDDFPTGAHEFIPLDAGDSFSTTQTVIYLVFRLVSDSYDAVPLSTQCFLETSEMSGQPQAIIQDHVSMSMSDQSGYFTLPSPEKGWTPGLYRCGLFAGDRTSAYNQVDEVRFRIIEPRPAS